jgi:hypothetical protein
MHDTNRQPLVTTARLLRPILNELVFVGGSVAGLLITDKGAPDVRATGDVDTIAEITSYAEYVRFSERLRSLGFSEDASAGAPLCRWRQGPAVLDVMPQDSQTRRVNYFSGSSKNSSSFPDCASVSPAI